MDQGIKRELELLSNLVTKEIKLMKLFVSVHGRKPVDYEEFDKWVALYEANSRTTNSRDIVNQIK